MIMSLSFYSAAVFAGMFPVISSISAMQIGNGVVEYHFKQSLVDIGPASETPLPGGGTYLTVLAAKTHSGAQDPIVYITNTISDQRETTAGEMARTLYGWYGSISTATISFVDPYDQCIAYISIPKTQYFWYSSTINPAGCTYIPPPTQMCKITSPEIVLDHGSIRLQDAEGHIAKTSLGVSCTNAMAVTFHLTTNQPYINLSPSGKSEIKIEDMPLNSKIDLPVGTKMLSVSDMLSGVSTEGVNAGSSVLVMEPY